MLIDFLIAKQETLASSGDPQAVALLEKLREQRAGLSPLAPLVGPITVVLPPVPGTILDSLFVIGEAFTRVPFPIAALEKGVARGLPVSLAIKEWQTGLDPDISVPVITPCPHSIYELLDELHRNELPP